MPGNISKKVKMMQSASYYSASKEKEGGRVTIGIDDLEGCIRALSNQRGLFCPNCGSKVILKAGAIKVPHFAHWDEEKAVDCVDEFYEPDGPEHQAMKLAALKFLRSSFPDALKIEMEVPITETGQRADVLAVRKDGQRFAIEVQVSPLTAEEWHYRHNLYRSARICDIWLMGYSRLNSKNLELLPQPGMRLPDGFEPYWLQSNRKFHQLENAIGLETKRIFYLDVLTDPNDPVLIMLCRLNSFSGSITPACLRYDFPFKANHFKLYPKIGLWTPYDRWSKREKEKQELNKVLAQQKLAEFIHKALDNTSKNLEKWQAEVVQNPRWPYLKNYCRLNGVDLEIWNTLVPGFRVIKCDPRLWMSYLYIETVSKKFTVDGQTVWPRRLARWLLKKEFQMYMAPAALAEYDYLEPLLSGFASYLSYLGVLSVDNNSNSNEETQSILAKISKDFPSQETIEEAKRKISQLEMEGFKEYLQRKFWEAHPEFDELHYSLLSSQNEDEHEASDENLAEQHK